MNKCLSCLAQGWVPQRNRRTNPFLKESYHYNLAFYAAFTQMFMSHPCAIVPLGLACSLCLAQSRKSLAATLLVIEQTAYFSAQVSGSQLKPLVMHF